MEWSSGLSYYPRCDIKENSVEWLDEFLHGFVNNASVGTFEVNFPLFPSDESVVPVFDLDHIVQNLKGLKSLKIYSSRHDMGPNQVQMITTALVNTPVIFLDIHACEFDGNGFEQVISSCLNVKELAVECPQNDAQVEVLHSLLRNPTAQLIALDLGRSNLTQSEIPMVMKTVVGNKRAKTLIISDYNVEKGISDFEDECDGSVQRLKLEPLCSLDISSIESICNSDHTLVEIYTRALMREYCFNYHVDPKLPEFVRDWLELNKGTHKNKVIRQKILKYYFVNDFDVNPFAVMPVSLLPEVMTLLSDESVRNHNALFRLVKNIPDLCNMLVRMSAHERGTSRKLMRMQNNSMYQDVTASV